MPDNAPSLGFATFLLLALIICAIGYSSYEYMKRDIQRNNERTLANLAESKARQINSWVEERRIDALVLSNKSHLAVLMEEWLRAGALDQKRQQWMTARLKVLTTLNQYDEMMLLDQQGIPLLSSSGDTGPPDGFLQQLAVESMRARRVLLSDMHWGVKGKPEMDMVAPLLFGEGKSERVVGAIYFHINPAQFLFPLIQSWPPSDTAETLIVRRDGNDVLHLNELRFRSGSTLTLRMPLSKLESPAVRAVRGETGIISGKDYRGNPVVAFAEPVNGLPWKMIAKIDENEIFAPVRRLAAVITTVTLLLLLLGTRILLERQRRLADMARYYKLQLDNQTLESRFSFISRFANDIILLTDERTNILDANERAMESYGYSREEFLKMTLRDLRPADQVPAFDEVLRILHEREGLVGEALHRRKDGTTFPVEFSVRRFVSAGRTYFQGILRDISERKQAEMALLNQKRFLQQIIDTDPNRILVTDAEGNYVLVNKAMAEAYHMTPEEMIGRNRFEVNPTGEAALYHKLDQAVIETRRQVTDIVPSTTRDGKEHWFLSIKVPMKHPGGTLQVLGISVDITEAKLTEDKLRRSEALFRTLVEHLPHKIFMKDRNSVYTFCNSLYAQDLGIAPSRIVGKMDKDFYPERMAAKFTEGDQRVIASGDAINFEESYLQNGLEKVVHTIKVPLRGADGKISGILGMFLDITERRRTERALLESEQRYRVWLDVAPVACVIWNPETYCVMEWNRMAETIFGWQREEVLGRNLLDFTVPEEEMEKVQSVLDFPLRTGITSHSINKNLTRDGNIITCEWYNAGLKSHEGRPNAVMSMCTDISERMQIAAMRSAHQDEMERSERLKVAGEMASGLTHELSQPLSAANNYIDACLRRMQSGEYDPTRQLQCLGLAHKQTERAGRIINHFKSLLRREDGPRAALNINQVARVAANYLEDEIGRYGIDLEMDLAPVPEIVACNLELEQVLFNLMKNAIEAMQDRSARKLRLSSRLENGAILVEVGDSGKGIPSSELEKIFDQFHTTKRDGLGLGLAICRTIVNAHDGRIEVKSTPGQGTTFSITLPLATIPESSSLAH